MSTKEKQLADSVFAIMEKAINAATAPLTEKIARLEERITAQKEPEPGKDGVGIKEAMIDRKGRLVITLTDGTVKKLDVIVGRDGKDGADGKSVDEKALYERIKGDVIKEIPEPVPGKDGIDGKDGENGKSIDEDALRKLIKEEVIKAIPEPIPGKDGKDGKNGKNGKSVCEKELTETIKALIPEPVAGPAGNDGASVTVDDLQPVLREMMEGAVKEMAPALKEHVENVAKELAKSLHPVAWAGTYKVDKQYEAGNFIQHAGSIWLAIKENPGSIKDKESWRLVVKSGQPTEAPKFEPKELEAVSI